MPHEPAETSPVPCAGLTDLFFSYRAADVDEAKALCACCDARTVCLERALADPATRGHGGGVWGGTTPAERAVILRQRRAAAS